MDECRAVASMDFNRVYCSSLSTEKRRTHIVLHRWTIECAFVLYRNVYILCVWLVWCSSAFAPPTAGVLVAGAVWERQLSECAPWTLLFWRSLLPCFFFFPFHLELLRCWVSYLRKWEKEGKLSEMVSLEYISHCRDASVYDTERRAVTFARSWRKKKKRNAQLWESFVSCSLPPSSPIYLCI